MVPHALKIRLSVLISVCALVLLLAACSSNKEESTVPEPSNAGAAGPAVSLTGDVTAGKTVYDANCTTCHGVDGKGGVSNPGSDDGTVPPLNPIDPGFLNADYKTYATNIDKFIEHGSTPEGTNVGLVMTAWGDTKALTSQQIADVIAYIISLNPAK